MVRGRKKHVAGPREDVRAAIERAWPEGVVEMTFDSKDLYFEDIYPKLKASFKRLRDAELLHERQPQGEPVWYDHSDPDEDPPDETGTSRTYHLFFVAPKGDSSDYTISMNAPSGAGEISGSGRDGWAVAVSLLAPFAVINLSLMENFEDGTITEPSMESVIFDDKGERIDPEVHYKELRSEEAFQVFSDLRTRIGDILSENGIVVLSEEEWRKPVPGLRADGGISLEVPFGPVRVLDALFAEGL